ncbi:TetR/AcrR family transcriptional regulator [Lacimicrobium alkaliphilum]|uniref:TetR family transcriptional regulator n=1 Tax=Lacimicrobium alkaliphilum TaxID=1526571 RepID=A0ABQ1RC72_9ALTE|nr:TetR/AcrR family transcriptional regulator [Lacimicrobium alkaliphilum]GGD62302.1 TetR family transcriptional regulator [Lacimicrobium alkaliphilum]
MGRSDNKHEDILCAAISEFGEKGMMATTMESIAVQAGVSKRTLYKHYPCKENLLDDVVSLLLKRVEPLKNITFNPHQPLLDQLRTIGEKTLHLICDEDYLRLSRIIIIESMRCEKAAKLLNQKFSDCEKQLYNWFSQASEAGVLGNIEPGLAATLFYGAIKEAAYWDQVAQWKPMLDKAQGKVLIDRICQFFIDGVQQSE